MCGRDCRYDNDYEEYANQSLYYSLNILISIIHVKCALPEVHLPCKGACKHVTVLLTPKA